MYQKLLERLKVYHNDEYLHQIVSSLTFIYYDARHVNSDHYALIIDDSDVMVFEMVRTCYNIKSFTEQFSNWFDVLTNYNYNNYMEDRISENTHREMTCTYCGERRHSYKVNNHIYLCNYCLRNLNILESGKLESKFPIILPGWTYKCNPYIDVYYCITNNSLDLWHQNSEYYQHLKFRVSNILSFEHYDGRTVFYNTDCETYVCYTCDKKYDNDSNVCSCCDDIFTFRDTLRIQLLSRKLLWISYFNTISDISTTISKLLVSLTLM